MANKISWVKSNPDNLFSSYEIYRSEDPATVFSGTPIKTIDDKSITEYIDNPPSIFGKYYYGLIVNSSVGKIKSNVIVSNSTKNPGTGSIDVMIGDNNYGLLEASTDMGLTRKADSVLYSYMKSKSVVPDISANVLTQTGFTSPLYQYKVIKDGKIFYFPCFPTWKFNGLSGNRFYTLLIEPWIAEPIPFTYEGIDYTIELMSREDALEFYVGGLTTNISNTRLIKRTYTQINGNPPAIMYKTAEDGNFISYTTATGALSTGFPPTTTSNASNVIPAYMIRPVE